MKAALCTRFTAPLEITEVRLAPPHRGKVEVTRAACAMCHSDMHFIAGAWGGRDYRIGQRLLVTLIRSCGTPQHCANGRPVICETAAADASPLSLPGGTRVTQGMKTGAFAKKVVVAASQFATLPDDMPLAVAARLACGVITGAGAVFNTAAMPAGASVVMIGTGGAGLNAIQRARIAGAGRIIARDVAPEKLAAAQEFGATGGFLATAPDAGAQVMALTDGRGAVMAYGQVPGLTAPGGTTIMAGMTGSTDCTRLNPMMVASQEQRLIGAKTGGAALRRGIARLIELHRQRRLKRDEVISNRYPRARINDAIADTAKGGMLRNAIMIDAGGKGRP
jgi:S-(hydroxymethyl)glutathione dehydrogenase / alcohol dehydrogenase